MLRSATNPKTSAQLANMKISDCDGLAPRQRQLLTGLFALFSSEIGARLEQMLVDLDQQMLVLAERAGSGEAQCLFETRDRIREHRAKLVPRFLARVEAALACLSEPSAPESEAPLSLPRFSELSLVEASDMDEAIALKEIAVRTELRSSLPLFLLGQRLGAVVGRPAFDVRSLPLGPYRLCQLVGEAAEIFELDAARRTLLYRQFDASVLRFSTSLFEALNHYLIDAGIFPNLSFVPPRSKNPQTGYEARGARTSAAVSAPRRAPVPSMTRSEADGWPGDAPVAARSPSLPSMVQPFAGSTVAAPAMTEEAVPRSRAVPAGVGQNHAAASARSHSKPLASPPFAMAATAADRKSGSAVSDFSSSHAPGASRTADASYPGVSEPDIESFDDLRRLLAGRRSLIDRLKPTATLGGPLATEQQLQLGLDRLQQRMLAESEPNSGTTFADLHRQLLEQMQRDAAGGQAPRLSARQDDAVSLIGMLFEHIGQEVRPASPGGRLLAQLQLPLLRLALQDEGFFVDRDHPARRMLDAVAEAGTYWSCENEVDTDLMQKMAVLVRRAAAEFDGQNPTLFHELMGDLTEHLTAQQHKAEVCERRHVEAARGREKLEIARLQAEVAIHALLAGRPVPKFLRTLLEQVWTDVLAMALLRGGNSSPVFQQYLALTRRLVAAAILRSHTGKSVIAAPEAESMRQDIEAALARIGQDPTEAAEVAGQMLSAITDADQKPESVEPESESGSRTELVMKLRGQARLGQPPQPPVSASVQGKENQKPAELSAEESVWHERLKRLPFGTWFEFSARQSDTPARRRMSWYSTVTDRCLFVNHRGQRVGEYTLSWLARELARGSVRAVESERGSLVDRAWKAIVKALRSFVGQGGDATIQAVPG